MLSQSILDGAFKKADDKPVRVKRKSSSEDVVPYQGLRVVTFENKKQHIVHCGKCLGQCSNVNFNLSCFVVYVVHLN